MKTAKLCDVIALGLFLVRTLIIHSTDDLILQLSRAVFLGKAAPGVFPRETKRKRSQPRGALQKDDRASRADIDVLSCQQIVSSRQRPGFLIRSNKRRTVKYSSKYIHSKIPYCKSIY
jgi:hypothetical protein